MKKQSVFILAIFLCVSLFTGCAKSEDIAEVTVHEHSFAEAEAIGASCADAGFVRFVCDCGEEYTEEIAPLGHTAGEWEVSKEATQTEQGLKKQFCDSCGDLLAAEPVPALALEEVEEETKATSEPEETKPAPGGIEAPVHYHKYSKTLSKEATCTSSGSLWYGCSCGAGYAEPIPAKGHDLKTRTIPGSCTADTIQETVCQDCGRVIASTVSQLAPGHKFSIFNQGWEVIQKATCEKAGLEERTCKVCEGVVESRTLAALGHSYKDGKPQAPSCEEDGCTSRTCSRCGNTITSPIPATGHAWAVKEVVKPTCDTVGYTLYICTNDNAHTKKGEEIAALGHQETKWQTTQDATCAAEGLAEEICTTCGKSLNTRPISKKGHSYQLSDRTAPSCTKNGSDVFTCQGCGDSYTEPLAALDHDYQVSECKASTCTEAGFVRTTCSRCGDTQEETLPLADHSYSLAEHKDATCLEDGFDRYTCACGDSYEKTISKTGHNYLNTQHKDATCTENGFDLFACSLCGNSYEEAISATSHHYSITAHQDASCESDGSDTYTCGNCGDTYTETIGATGHSHQLVGDNGHIKTFTCSRCGDNYSEIYGEEHHFSETETVSPTCTSQGYVHYICDDCGETYTETLPTLAHNAKSEVVKEATCAEEGLRVSTCASCGQELSRETVARLPHTMKTEITRQPDCCNEGEETTACAVCGGEQATNTIPKLPHTEEVLVSREATCTQEGEKTTACAVCSEIISTETTPKLPHKEVQEITQPTCTEAGSETVRCSMCGEVISQTDIAALGHSYEKIHSRPATCEEDGEDRFQCSRCGDNYGETIPKLNHNYIITETVNPSCQGEGRIVRTCEHCQDEQVEALPELAHAYKQTVQAGTCVEEEKTVSTCENCGDTYVEITGGLGDHLFERTSYKAATCTKDGEIVDTCQHCGERKVEVIQAMKHNFQRTETVQPTCFEDGYMKFVCQNCGESYQNILPAQGHWEGNWEVVKEATKTETGLRRKYCLSCREILEEEIIEMLPGIDQEFVIDLGGGETATVVGHLDYDMANEIFEMLNAYRVENGKAALKTNASLAEGVGIRAPELAQLFSHTRPNGLQWSSVSTAARGENIASKYLTAQSVMDGWKNSPGHNENMLRDTFKSAAIGVFAQRITLSGGSTYYIYHYVQLFGTY